GPPPRPKGEPERLDVASLERQIATGAYLLDVRGNADFATEHIPGSVNIALGKSFANWAGSLIPYDRDVVLLAERRGDMERAMYALALIGLDRVAGWGDRVLRDAWRERRHAFGSLASIGTDELSRLISGNGDVRLVDVRSDAEWKEGHIP